VIHYLRAMSIEMGDLGAVDNEAATTGWELRNQVS